MQLITTINNLKAPLMTYRLIHGFALMSPVVSCSHALVIWVWAMCKRSSGLRGMF